MEGNPRILHVIERLAPGGAATAMVETARRLVASGQHHAVLSLAEPVPAAAAYARDAGLALVDAADEADAMAQADLVWIHAWTSPALDAFLRRAHPPGRWLIWLHVAGDSAPHLLSPLFTGMADALVATSAYTLGVPAFAAAPSAAGFVLAGSDLERFAQPCPRPAAAAVRIGYIGTLDAAKMHPDFVALSRAACVPGARFDIHGRGAGEAGLRREIARSGDARFRLCGWAADVRGALAEMDIFGYPLARGGYATAELVLQEAMAAGVPPVILDHGAAVHLVGHERTGLIARDESDYSRCLERLAGDLELRERLGAAARRKAMRDYGAASTVRAIAPILDRLLAQPKAARGPVDAAAPGADRFLAALGPAAAPFEASRAAAQGSEADARIAACSPALASAASGGILHWRAFYPDDPWLRLWSGLVLMGQGRRVPALGEFMAAVALGLPPARAEHHAAQCRQALASPAGG
jgi:glycosyltransferase involved in cell wall biosynthesis